ncbi:MAG TPA: hypothetical protein VJ123_10820 [Anaerolineales bacterium]|nr:hypothetical protein [Anaerolineales bacterium]
MAKKLKRRKLLIPILALVILGGLALAFFVFSGPIRDLLGLGGVRRLEAEKIPTPYRLGKEDDARAQLDAANPEHYDSLSRPETWFDFDTEGHGAYRVEDEHLFGIDYEPEEIYTWWSYTSRQGGNVYAEITAKNGDCAGRDSVGLAIRVDPQTASGGYALEVSCDGNWRFRRHRTGKEPVEMVNWTPSNAIREGRNATNHLGVWGARREFLLYVNGEQVGQATDPQNSYTSGIFAAYVRASLTFDLTATFDDFAYWNIPFQP